MSRRPSSRATRTKILSAAPPLASELPTESSVRVYNRRFRQWRYGRCAEFRWHFNCSSMSCRPRRALNARREGKAMGSKQSPADEPRATITSLKDPFRGATQVVFTRDHELIKQWAEKRQAMPATG